MVAPSGDYAPYNAKNGFWHTGKVTPRETRTLATFASDYKYTTEDVENNVQAQRCFEHQY